MFAPEFQESAEEKITIYEYFVVAMQVLETLPVVLYRSNKQCVGQL